MKTIPAAWVLPLTAFVLMVAPGCTSVPEISIPQLEAARRAVEEPRHERGHVYQQCLQKALDPPPGDKQVLIDCMREQRYVFVAETAPHRIEHCLEMRNTEGKFPEDFCFQKMK